MPTMETPVTQESTPTEEIIEDKNNTQEVEQAAETVEVAQEVTSEAETGEMDAASPEGEAEQAAAEGETAIPEASESPAAAEEAAEAEAQPEEEHAEESSSEAHPMEALLEEEFDLKRFRRGQIVEGIIVAIGDNEIIIDIGGKSEGIVPGQDLSRLDEEFLNSLNVGDEIVAYVLQPEGREGHTVLSLSRAQVARDWRRMEELKESGETISAPVVESNRGGVVVRVGQLRGFVPASQLERRTGAPQTESPEDRFNHLQGEQLSLKVLEVDRKRRRLILSERAAMREQREKERQRLLEELREGEVRHGRVTSITNFGAFVDLGGIDGLIHISELAWRHVKHPSEVLKVGDEVDVYVLSVDREKGRVGLSLRRLQPKPWETVLDRYAIGQVVEGTVTKITPFGAFVRLEDGIEGLIHISELADRRVEHPREVVKEGETVRVRILRIDPEAKRMGLSLKQAAEEAYVEVDWDIADEDEEDTGSWEVLEDLQTAEEESPVAEVSTEETDDEKEGTEDNNPESGG